MSKIIPLTKEPYWEVREELKKIEDEIKNSPKEKAILTQWYGIFNVRVYSREACLDAFLGAAEIGIANKIYKQKYGKYVNSLTQLTPGILSSLPLDPFTGKNYTYKRKDKGFIVYSVGDNLKDDKGVSAQKKKWKGDYDIVWEDNGAGTPIATGKSPGYAQPGIPKEQIPSGIPAEVKTEIEKLYSSNTRERADAIMKLRYMGMSGEADPAIPFLIQMLGSDNEFPAMILMASSLSPITSSCSSKYTFGGEAAETLARIGKASDELLGLLKDHEWRVRSNAIRALGGLKDVRAVDPLIAFLWDKNEHPEVRGNAALALGLMGARPAIDPLIVLLKDKNPEVRAAAASALGELRDPRALQPLIAALEDEDAHVRIRVTIGLGNIGGPSVLNPLVRALKDHDRQVREVAAGALGRVKDLRAIEPLIAALNDEYINVQINAAGALGEIKDPRAVEPLISMLSNDNAVVRGAAAQALGNLKDPRALQPLIAMVLKEKNDFPRSRALKALAKTGHAGARKAFEEYGRHRLDWKEWWNRNKADLLKK